MNDPAVELTHLLRALRGDIYTALARMGAPAYVIDREGTFRWLNAAGHALWPNALNRKFSTVIAPEEVRHAREQFARKMIGESDSTDYATAIIDADGRRIEVDVSSVSLRANGDVVGVFGVVTSARAQEPTDRRQDVELTPRQYEVLRLLGEGRTTGKVASDLGIAEETARNHIKAVLRALGARSRLEAVVAAHRRGLL
ncbi:MAG: LuxR C-terminal-related transcriptional regulator [Actinomycetota bacterium]|nr:LuxR C-terminal-related transcriptional regulator [Actinomycetota bacterium]